MTLAECSLPDRFRAQVLRHPDRLAIEAADRSLTYVELGCAVNAAANAILDRGCGRAERVVLLMDQGIPAVIATLGALSAAAAYVPLDPMLTPEQLLELVEHADPALIIADRCYLALARAMGRDPSRILCSDDIDGAGDASAPAPALAVSPDALACIYYTSGSTGKPKGVFDSHRNVLHNIWRYTTNLRIGTDDRLTLLQAPHFSGAVSSMFCALLNGAACFPYDLRRDGLGPVGAWLRSRRITMYHSVPSIFREVIAGGDFPALRCVRLEGDRASRRDIELFRRHCPPHSMLANGLGATECGLVRQWRIDAATPIPEGPIPIGEPVDDMEVLLLGADRNEVPVGEVGEIAVRSRYLALGYWREPELTAARFLSDDANPMMRTYLTGDLGRMPADGLLQYLGRKDSVSRIRGQWVDLDAVERALTTAPGVREAVVSIRQESDRDPLLVAYAVAEAGVELSAAVMRRHVAARVPLHMVPSAWVILTELPLNANLKVDRGALPAPDPAGTAGPAGYVAPRNPLERHLRDIWSEVLGIERIGVHDDVLGLGADSLAITRVRNRLATALSLELPIAMLFDKPSIAALANEIEKSAQPPRDAT